MREAVKALCEPVELPRDTGAYLRYFCAEASGDARQLKDNEPKRLKLYTLVAAFVRAYANLANEMGEAGYSTAEAQGIHDEVRHYEKVRAEVKLASGDAVDLKAYEPAMRHLLDTYVRAEESERLSAFDDLSLVPLIVDRGEKALNALPGGIRESREATAETIENNVRRLIIDEMAVNPQYFERMSKLLDALILQRRQEALDYKEYLDRITDLARKVTRPEAGTAYPPGINTGALRSLFDNLEGIPASAKHAAPHGDGADRNLRQRRALDLDRAIRDVKKADWRGNHFKEREVRSAIRSTLAGDDGPAGNESVDRIFEIVKAQHDY